jgi:SAM-dependent methyltransferase
MNMQPVLSTNAARSERILYALAIFLAAFLLFLVQPMIAKTILPWFGGAAAVWITCLIFFQGGLLAGYGYSHWSARRLRPGKQALFHGLLLLCSIIVLPVLPGAPGTVYAGSPVMRIFRILLGTIGLPFFLLASTSPLLQAWYGRRKANGLPYRLYALSNLASLFGLLAYPFLIEPRLTLSEQFHLWSASYILFVCSSLALALLSMRRESELRRPRTAPVLVTAAGPAAGQYALWLLLSACGSVLLLAVTNYLTQQVASVPFLWVLPLSVYLLSFVLSFDHEGWYRRSWYVWLVSLSLLGISYFLIEGYRVTDMKVIIPLFSVGLFFCLMFCHGELASRKPAVPYVTSFYLMIAAGGVLGGVLVGLAAPAFFTDYYELPLGMLWCGLLLLFINYRRSRLLGVVCGLLVIRLLLVNAVYLYSFDDGTLARMRNFYGTLKVIEHNIGRDDEFREMAHGNITHGIQYRAPGRRREPLTYYTADSGVGMALKYLGQGPRRVGIVGLGAGSLAVYCRRGDLYRFYEIDPQVIELARKYFSFLGDARGKVQVVEGDGRLSIEREKDDRYDLLVIDAFSGDAIPVHLLTLQAVRLYFDHLKPDGILAVNISNRHLDLSPVLGKISAILGIRGMEVRTSQAIGRKVFRADWVLMTSRSSFFDIPELKKAAEPLPPASEGVLWTDDYNNLWRVFR